MDADVLGRVVGTRVAQGWPAYAAGWRLAFCKGGEGGEGGEADIGSSVTATIMREENCRVYGVVYRLGLQALKPLDAFEGVPEHYERERIWVEPRGRRAKQAALTYVARPEWLVESGRPESAYVEAILRGARAHGLPNDYVVWLEALAHGRAQPCYRADEAGGG